MKAKFIIQEVGGAFPALFSTDRITERRSTQS